MDDQFDRLVPNADSADIMRRIRMHTPARLEVGRQIETAAGHEITLLPLGTGEAYDVLRAQIVCSVLKSKIPV
jgi:hypothetical protein